MTRKWWQLKEVKRNGLVVHQRFIFANQSVALQTDNISSFTCPFRWTNLRSNWCDERINIKCCIDFSIGPNGKLIEIPSFRIITFRSAFLFTSFFLSFFPVVHFPVQMKTKWSARLYASQTKMYLCLMTISVFICVRSRNVLTYCRSSGISWWHEDAFHRIHIRFQFLLHNFISLTQRAKCPTNHVENVNKMLLSANGKNGKKRRISVPNK